jgi:hypothetical protein
LRVDDAPTTVSYLKFEVPDLAVAPTKATLRVFRASATSSAVTAASVADTSWTELGLTYMDRPATGAAEILSMAPSEAGVWLSFDVTSLVTAGGLVSFALDGDGRTRKRLSSREAAANQPQLVIDTDPLPTSIPLELQPDVQQWLLDREPLQIEMNDALVPFVQHRIDESACRRLAAAVQAWWTLGPAPYWRVDELVRAGLPEFEQGAAHCLAGEPVEAERLVHDGLTKRTEAAAALDDLLQGP